MSIIINGSNTPTAGSAAIGNGTELAFTAAGTAGQVLTSQGSSNAIWSSVGVAVGSVTGLGTNVATFLATPSSANLAAALTDETGTGANVFATSPALTTPTITGLNEVKTAPTISVGVLALNCASGNVFTVSLNAAITSVTFSNIPTTGNAYGLTLALSMTGTAYTISWPASVKWSGGNAPTLTSTLNKVDIFCLTTWDGGTTWYAMVGGQNF